MKTRRLISAFMLWFAAFSTVGLFAQDLPHHISALDWSPNGTMIAVGMGTASESPCQHDTERFPIRLIDPDSQKQTGILTNHICSVDSLDFNTDGTRLISGSRDGVLILWDMSTQIPEKVGNMGADITQVLWSPDNTKFLVNFGSVAIDILEPNEFDQVGGMSLAQNIHTAAISDAVWSPDGQEIVTSSLDQTIRVWNIATEETISHFQMHNRPVIAVSWNHTTDVIASGDAGGTIHIWDPADAENIYKLTGHTGPVNIVKWSPDGQYLASGGDDGTVRVWDGTTGEEIGVLTYPGAVLALDWSPDSTRLVYGGRYDDGTDAEVMIEDAPQVKNPKK